MFNFFNQPTINRVFAQTLPHVPCEILTEFANEFNLELENVLSKINSRYITQRICFLIDRLSMVNNVFIDERGCIKAFLGFCNDDNECTIIRDAHLDLYLYQAYECMYNFYNKTKYSDDDDLFSFLDTISYFSDNGEKRMILHVSDTNVVKEVVRNLGASGYKRCNESKSDKYFSLEKSNYMIIDDIGNSFDKFNNITGINPTKLYNEVFNKEYRLIDKELYAPYSKNKNLYCVLYANNNYIRVLRWNPANHDSNSIYDSKVYELGFVLMDDGKILYDNMIESGNYLLFGLVNDNSIKIIGGYEEFSKNGCLKDYILPHFIAKKIL